MLFFLPAPVRGAISLLLLILNTLFWFSLLLPCSLLKALLPLPVWQRFLTRVMIRIAESWIAFNSDWMRLAGSTEWDVQGRERLDHDGCYLVTSNHQSWVDILALQRNLNRRMPMPKFFLRSEER